MEKEDLEVVKTQMEELTQSVVNFIFEEIKEKLKEFKIEYKKELEQQFKRHQEETLIAVSKIADRITKDIN